MLGEWCCEVNVFPLPTGRLVAAMRYQRPLLPDDPDDLLERTGASTVGADNPYKHVAVTHSDDRGRTWTPPRQVATVFGQCYGSGVGLLRNRAVVTTDYRYPRDMGSGRALVSLDGGETWQDEVYYLTHGPRRRATQRPSRRMARRCSPCPAPATAMSTPGTTASDAPTSQLSAGG